MRIAYLTADFGVPVRGNKGSSVHVREMVAALVRQGHEVRVFTPNPSTGNEVAAPLYLVGPGNVPDRSVTPVPWPVTRIGAGRTSSARLRKELRELRFNFALFRSVYPELVVWQPQCIYERYSLFSLGGLGLARRLQVPHLLEVNAPLREERERTIGLKLRSLSAITDRLLFGGSSRLLVVSGALREYVIRHGARPDAVTLLPNAVDVARFKPAGAIAEDRRRVGIPGDAFVVGFAGSLKPWHGVELLLAAFSRVHAKNHAARLLIVGTGPQRDVLLSRAAELRIGNAVIFTGSVPHNEMAAMLRIMNVGVAPYLDVPSFYFSPLKIYEYMATGLPVVASDAGEIGTLVRHGETGLLFSPGDVDQLTDRLTQIMTDSTLALRLGARARDFSEQHSWDRNAKIVTDLVASDKRNPVASIWPSTRWAKFR